MPRPTPPPEWERTYDSPPRIRTMGRIRKIQPGSYVRVRKARAEGQWWPYNGRIGQVTGFTAKITEVEQGSPIVHVVGLVPGEPREIIDYPNHLLRLATEHDYDVQKRQDEEKARRAKERTKASQRWVKREPNEQVVWRDSEVAALPGEGNAPPDGPERLGFWGKLRRRTL